MILNLIKFVHAMAAVIHGVSKGNKFLLSNYSLTYQLFFINLFAAFLGFVSLLIFNFYLIQNNRIITDEYDNALLETTKITSFLSKNSIKRIPLFNENCEKENNSQECEINISDPVLDPTIAQDFIMQNFLKSPLDVIVYNHDWIKFADTNDMYINTEVVEIDIDAKIENSNNFLDQYRSIYINLFNEIRINFIKNKYIKISKNLKSEINIVSETIKKKKIVENKYNNKEEDIFQFISSPILYNDRVFGVVIVSYPLFSSNYELGLNSFNLFNFYIFLVIIILLLSFIFSQSLVNPIKILSKLTLLERSKLKLKKSISYPVRGDEIGVLSKEIQNMSLDLKSQINQLEKFAADVSHELKNPLASLQSANELISNEKISAKNKKLLVKNMSRDIQRMNWLISDISNFTKIIADIETESFEYININNFINEVIKNYYRNKKNIKIKIENICNEKLKEKVCVLANKDKLSRVFFNLIDNSVSILENNKKILIKINTINYEYVELKVYDQGKGIPTELSEKVFHRFYTDRDNDVRFHSGLGLSISREIIKSFQGSIKLINSDKQDYSGACFIINLPLKLH